MIVLIAGGSASGKTTLAQQFENSCIVHQDNFYIGESKMKKPYNFDDPSAIDFKELCDVVQKLNQNSEPVKSPLYSMIKGERDGFEIIEPKNLIIVEGAWVIHHLKLRNMADFRIYIDTPIEERVKRRIVRDVERGRNAIETLEWSVNVEKMHMKWVEPQKKFADLIVKT